MKEKKQIRINEASLRDMVREAIYGALKEFNYPDGYNAEYQGNDLDYDTVYEEAIHVISQMDDSNLDWRSVARNMGFRLETLNMADAELLHDAIEDAMLDSDEDYFNESKNNRLNKIVSESVRRVLSESVSEFEYGETEDLGQGRHRQIIYLNGKEIGFLVTREKNFMVPLEEVYVLPDVDQGMSEPTDSLRDGAEGWIEFKRFTDYDEALRYATENFDEIAHLFEFGDWD